MQWLDLKDAGGARLKFAISDGRHYLLVFGLTPARREWRELIDAMGYKPSGRQDYLIRAADGQQITVREYATVFPNTVKREFEREKVEVKFQTRAPQQASQQRPVVPAAPGRAGPAAAARSDAAAQRPAPAPATAPAPAPAVPRGVGSAHAASRDETPDVPPSNLSPFGRLAQFTRNVMAARAAPSSPPASAPAAPVAAGAANAAPDVPPAAPRGDVAPAAGRPAAPDSAHQQPRRAPAADARGVAQVPPETETDGFPTEDAVETRPPRSEEEEDAQSLATDDGATRYWGRNLNGDQVFEGAFGRYILREADQVQVAESDLPAPVYFLRANTPEDVMGCADGFVKSMLRGEVQYQEDIGRLAEAMFGADDQGQILIARAAVEAAMTRSLRREFEVPHDAYDAAVQMYERLPEARVTTRGSAALPLPLSVAAQWLVGDTRGKTVAIPNAYDGALASVLIKDSKVRAGRASQLHPSASPATLSADIAWQEDISALDAQALIFNDDPAAIEPRTIDGVTVDRADYAGAMEQLRKLDGAGRAVVILAGEDPLDAGVVKSDGSRDFYNWLAHCFRIDTAFETNLELQRRAGTHSTLRVVALEKRAPHEVQRIERFRVLHDWDAVRDLVRDTIRDKGIEEAQPEGINVEREAAENNLQVPYQSAARLGEARTMVPKNMYGALNEKFAEVAALYGPVEQIVGRALNLSPAELAERYSPEQMDAVALGMLRIEKDNRGIIVGDETGIGKGRTIAALCSWANGQHRKVIFITKGSNLFSDLVRDLKDAQVWDAFQPFVVNAEASLVDMMGDRSVLAKGTPVEDMRAIVASGTTLDDLGKNIVFATYSQFNGKDSPKAKWLLEQCADALVVVDEAHEAAGSSSNIANFIETLTDECWGVVYSSATWAKTLDNISIYRRALPRQVNAATLRETMRRGGEGFMETFSTMLAREGALIRREHDMSRLVVDVKADTMRLPENERISDQISEVLGAMAFVSGETNRLFTRMNSGANDILARAREKRTVIVEMIEGQARERALSAREQEEEQAGLRRLLSQMRVARLQFNLGTNLYQTIRRVEAALTAQYTADLAIAALQEGRKPVIVFEDTNEALTKKMIADARRELVAQAERDGTPLDQLPKITDIPTPNIKHMLRSLSRSLGVVSWTNAADMMAEGNAGRRAADAEVETEDGDAQGEVQFIEDIEGLPAEFVTAYREGMQRIMEAIDALPEMPIVVPDIIRSRLVDAGYKVGEVSGRVLTAVDQGNGRSLIVGRNNSKKVVTATVAAFNDGEIDALQINRAGSAGISMHSSPRFRDTRQRHLFETQIPNNVSDRIQLFGRVNRYDQLSFPLVTGVSSGLYASLRLLMMQNNKVRQLSANTRSSRNSAFEDHRIPDLLNSVGREAAFELLQDNAGMMLRLGLDPSILEDDQASRHDFADVVMKRVPLLKVAEQRRVYEELASRFDDIILRAEMKGENPLRAQEIGTKVKQGERRILSGIEIPGQSIFDAPVYISEIRWEQEIHPMRWTDVIEQVKGARAMLAERGVAQFDNSYAHAVSAGALDMSQYASRVGRMYDAMARISLQATGHDTVEAAMQGAGYNAVKRTVERATWFAGMATRMLPGAVVKFPQFGEEEKPSFVVVNWSLPGQNREINLDQYRLQLAAPGDTRPFELTLASLFSYKEDLEIASADVFSPTEDAFLVEMLQSEFNNATGGRVIKSKKILDGNLYAASELAAENKLGSGVIFTDEKGVKRRAVLLNSSVSDFNLMHIPRAINRTEILQRLGQGFRQFGENTTLAIHLSLREAMKRKGGEVIYFVQKDGQFQWQWMMDKAEIRRFKEKLRMQGHEGTIDHGIQIKPRRRDSTLVFSSSIDLLEPALKARGIETVYLTRLDYGPVHDVIDVLEQRYREQQIALREAALRQREEQQAAERAALEAEITARDARGEDDNDGGERQAA